MNKKQYSVIFEASFCFTNKFLKPMDKNTERVKKKMKEKTNDAKKKNMTLGSQFNTYVFQFDG